MSITAYFLGVGLFYILSCLGFTMARNYSNGDRFYKKTKYIIALINALTFPVTAFGLADNPALAYGLFTIIVVFEILFLFKEKLLGNIAIAFTIVIHFFACRSIALGVQSIMLDKSMHFIIHDQKLLIENIFITVGIHIVMLILVIVIIPIKTVKYVLSRKVFLINILILMVVLQSFFVYNTRIFEIFLNHIDLSIQQIVLPIFMLLVFYVMFIFMIMLQNVSEYKQKIEDLEVKIDKSEALNTALFNIADIIIEINLTKNNITRALIANVEITSSESGDISKEFREALVKFVHPEDLEIFSKLNEKEMKELLSSGQNELTLDYRANKIEIDTESLEVKTDESYYLWHRLKINVRVDEETKDIIAVCTINENHEEKESELDLLQKSEADMLTGAYNKVAIKSKVSEYIENNGKGTLFVFDIDNFKSVNDNMGHAYGDEILLKIYEDVKRIVRKEDFIGRFGGDEFVVFIKDCIEETELIRIAQAICESVKKVYTTNEGIEILVSASIGIACVPKDADNYDDLFICADKALYESKNKGKNTFTFYIRDLKNF